MAFSLDDFFDEPVIPAQSVKTETVEITSPTPDSPPWETEVISDATVESDVEPEAEPGVELDTVSETEAISEQIRQIDEALEEDMPAWKRSILTEHKNGLHNRYLQSIVNNEALEFAMYTVEDRAIPSMVDGLKPVQRFFMYRALEYAKQSKTKFNKVAALAGGVSEAGYHHGEASAAGAGQMIANTWNNNIPILEGDGNFGSRLVKQAAAPRYVFCRVHKNFWDIYRDLELAPAHFDPEHLPPKYYLPVIPMVLANGVKGIATGYATDIFPYSYKSLVASTIAAIKGEEIPAPVIQFPEFKGKINIIDDKSITVDGLYELSGQTKLVITELPVKYDRVDFVTILDKLKETNKIVGYKEQCGEGFRFEITLKRQDKFGDLMAEDPDKAHDKIMKMFKLRQAMSQNITVLDENGKLKKYETAVELIRDFVKIRKEYVDQRVEYERQKAEHGRDLAWAKFKFINMVLEDKIVIKGKQKVELINELNALDEFRGFENELVGMSIYRLTEDELHKLQAEALKQTKEFEYWSDTTSDVEYINDLKSLEDK
ncbi:DNA topoisomerase subunit [Aeromonas phage Asfd_1]|nr:DNA topoisomerase subunit [Aeromonas phage Asfd_1]